MRVFLCHASDDKAAVRQLYRRLKDDGLNPWLDEEDILPGKDWDTEIRDAIANSSAIIACLSPASVIRVGDPFKKRLGRRSPPQSIGRRGPSF